MVRRRNSLCRINVLSKHWSAFVKSRSCLDVLFLWLIKFDFNTSTSGSFKLDLCVSVRTKESCAPRDYQHDEVLRNWSIPDGKIVKRHTRVVKCHHFIELNLKDLPWTFQRFPVCAKKTFVEDVIFFFFNERNINYFPLFLIISQAGLKGRNWRKALSDCALPLTRFEPDHL